MVPSPPHVLRYLLARVDADHANGTLAAIEAYVHGFDVGSAVFDQDDSDRTLPPWVE